MYKVWLKTAGMTGKIIHSGCHVNVCLTHINKIDYGFCHALKIGIKG